jgi:glucokinase
VRRVYAREAGLPFDAAPEPKVIADIARGTVDGHRPAAAAAFREMGEVLGDVLAQALTLLDGAAVIGGGLAAASDLFMPAAIDALRDVYPAHDVYDQQPRLGPRAYNLDDPEQCQAFMASRAREIIVPGTEETVTYDPALRTPVGLSRLGTSEAVALGAYAFALQRLDRRE